MKACWMEGKRDTISYKYYTAITESKLQLGHYLDVSYGTADLFQHCQGICLIRLDKYYVSIEAGYWGEQPIFAPAADSNIEYSWNECLESPTQPDKHEAN